MRKSVLTTVLILSLFLMTSGLSACSEKEQTDVTAGGRAGTKTEEMTCETENGSDDEDAVPEKNEEEVINMTMKINDEVVNVTWENNESVKALMKMAAEEPVVVNMSMYGGFEQVGPIGQSIISDDQQTTTQAGDVVLYSGDQIVAFYGSNSWAYTRLGHADLSQKEMEDLLGNGDVIMTLQMED